MFGKKEQKIIKQALPEEMVEKKMTMDFTTIPDVFYGGIDPKVEYKEVDAKKIQQRETKVVDKPKELEMVKPIQIPVQQTMVRQLTKPPKKKMSIWLIILMAVGFTAVIILVSWYYLNQAGFFDKTQDVTPNQPNENVGEIPNQIPTETVPEVVTSTPTTTPQEVITTPPSLQEVALEFPSTNFINTEDLDEDNLTDLEEEIFSTDSGVWDSDQDSYYDGQELVNLYNPKGFAPVRLINSGLVREYTNPTWEYRIYYPVVWEVASVDSSSNQVLISSITGEYIEIRALSKEVSQTFLNWFSQKAVGQKFTDLSQFINRFSQDGYRRADNLVAYFIQDETVFIVLYQAPAEGPIKYRHVVEMMMQSFRYGNSVGVSMTNGPLIGFGENNETATSTTLETFATSTTSTIQ